MSQTRIHTRSKTADQSKPRPKPPISSQPTTSQPAASQPRPANSPGRPPFFTEVVRAEVCAVIATGCPFQTAAKYVGCTVKAIYALKKRDPEFAKQLARALAQRELIPLSHIREASGRSWRAAAWLLEHTVGGRYGGHVMTLAEELAAEEAEESAELSVAVPDNHRTPTAGFAVQNAAFDWTDSGSGIQASSFEIEIPGFGKLRPKHATQTNKQRESAATLAHASLLNATDRSPLPTATTASPSALPEHALLSASVDPEQILKSMKALDESALDESARRASQPAKACRDSRIPRERVTGT
jgi:hypothetical protein